MRLPKFKLLRKKSGKKPDSTTDNKPRKKKRPKPPPPAWLAPNVLHQRPDQPFSELMDLFPGGPSAAEPIGLVHVVNLFSADGSLDPVQHKTVESMRRAADSPEAGRGKTRLVQVPARGDEALCPDGFQPARPLERDVLDIARFQRPRPLPLLFDVLDHGAELAGDGDFIVYTNSDICLQPHFYGAVRALLAAGFDAITINRRTIGNRQIELPLALALAETGTDHRGFDCFVFSKSAYKRYLRCDCCLGIPAVERPLLYNMAVWSTRMLMLKNVSLTYHFGNDRTWLDPSLADYAAHNAVARDDIVRGFSRSPDDRARLRKFCINHRERAEVIELLGQEAVRASST